MIEKPIGRGNGAALSILLMFLVLLSISVALVNKGAMQVISNLKKVQLKVLVDDRRLKSEIHVYVIFEKEIQNS